MFQPGEVRRADVEHFALLHKDFHRLPDLVEWRAAVDVVHLIEVDVVGLQSTQRSFARVPDVPRRQERVVGPVAHRAVELGGDDHLLAPAATLRKPSADDLLGESLALLPAVDVGGVEEVETGVECRVHDRVRRRLVGLRTEVHGAEAEAADRQPGASEVRVFHDGESGASEVLASGSRRAKCQSRPRITRMTSADENPRRCSAPATRMRAR